MQNIFPAFVAGIHPSSLTICIITDSNIIGITSQYQIAYLQAGGESGVLTSILSTTGELAKVAGTSLRPHVGDILSLIIDAVGQPNGAGRSVVAVITLGQASSL